MHTILRNFGVQMDYPIFVVLKRRKELVTMWKEKKGESFFKKLGYCERDEKAVKLDDCYTDWSFCTSKSFQKVWNKTWFTWDERKNRDQTDHSMLKIGWNAEKCSGGHRRLPVFQKLMKIHQSLRLQCKTFS